MRQLFRTASLIAASAAFLNLAACATSKDWAVSGGSRDEGLVRVSYEYPKFEEPTLSGARAEKLALQRCEGWGYDEAEPIAGQLRQCSSMDAGSCDIWRVTREFQCTRDLSFAGFLSK